MSSHAAHDPGGPEFAIVPDGTVSLVLETVDPAAGDVLVRRGARHARSSRGGGPAVVACGPGAR